MHWSVHGLLHLGSQISGCLAFTFKVNVIYGILAVLIKFCENYELRVEKERLHTEMGGITVLL